MSDVILYAALKENQRLAYADSGGPDTTFYETPQPAGYPVKGGSGGSLTCPQLVIDWETNLKPVVQTGSSGFKVCDVSGYYRCGAGCAWTVPAGVDRVQFQIWGPGGGTSTNCCCGGAPFGPSGAYMIVQMDVTPGESFTLCSGCAYCCYAYQTTPGFCGSPSYITGTGFGLCVDSGLSCYCEWNADLGNPTHSCGLWLPDPGGNGCGAMQCSGWNFCWDTNGDDVCVPYAFSRQSWRFTTAPSGRNHKAYGLNGLWPSIVIPNSGMQSPGYTSSTPVFGFESCVKVEYWNGNTCSGCCRSAVGGNEQLAIPSAGGYASQVYSGCQSCGGDSGRMGMICVSYGGIT